MKKIFTIVLLAGMMMGLSAQEAEYTLLRHSFTHNADGSFDVQYRKELKLLRPRAFTAYATQDGQGESFILYNPEFMRLTINEAYTLLPDGSKVQTPKNAFIEQLPEFCTKCGPYNKIREMVVVHTALEVGATIVLDYTLHITNKSGYFSKDVPLQYQYPVRRLEIKGFDGKDTLLTNVSPKPHMPSMYIPVKSYNAVYGNRPSFPEENEVAAASDILKKLKKENPMETAKAISNWVGENIHQNDIDNYMLYDYKILPASEVFANSCGTIHDINNLIRVLLNMAGIHTEWTQLNGNKTSIPKANFDGMDYMVTSSQFIGVFPIGGAIDEDEYTENKIDKKLEWKPELLADGFARMNLPSDYSVIRKTLMAYIPTTTLPYKLNISTYDHTFHYTLELPKGARLLGGEVNLQEKVDGLGEVVVNINQKKRNVEVNIKIQVLPKSIEPKQYDDFRKLVSVLANVESLLFKL